MLKASRFSLVAALIVVGAATAGCGEEEMGPSPIPEGPGTPVPALGIDPTIAYIMSGEKLQFEALGSLAQSVPAEFALTWTSSNPEVGEVDSGGLLSSRAPGSTVVTVTIAGQSASAHVFVGSNTPPQGPKQRRNLPQ